MVVQRLEVEDDLLGLLDRERHALGEQLGDGDPVEVGQLGEAADGDRPVASLVGTDDDGLPLAAGLVLDALQRQPLLHADVTQPVAERFGVVRCRHAGINSNFRYERNPIVDYRR
ncbi:hypothetical protein GCM10009783_19530 [Glycomyces lechevalierae]